MGRSGASLRRSSVHVVGLRVDVAGREDWERQCEQVIEVRWHIRLSQLGLRLSSP
jgi:hypothetical protein